MLIFDANVILRYLLDDNAEMAEKAEKYLAAGDVWVTVEVVAEVVYVLKGVYSLERGVIAKTVQSFLALVHCRDMAVLRTALEVYSEHSLDFVDCVLFAYCKEEDAEILTYDQKLLKLLTE